MSSVLLPSKADLENLIDVANAMAVSGHENADANRAAAIAALEVARQALNAIMEAQQ